MQSSTNPPTTTEGNTAMKGDEAETVVPDIFRSSAMKFLELGDISPSPTDVRKRLDVTKLNELLTSIKARGIIQPLLVRELTKEQATGEWKGPYVLVNGKRRLAVAKQLKMKYVPAFVRTMTDAEAVELELLENMQRADVHFLDEAAGFQAMLQYWPLDQVAAKLDKKPSYIAKHLALNQLIPEAKETCWQDQLPLSHALEIARLTVKDQATALKMVFNETVFGGSLVTKQANVRVACSLPELQRWIRENLLMDLHAATFKKDDAKLVPKAGACTDCPKRTGFNTTLFPELAEKDRCTDSVCFNLKIRTHMANQTAKIQAQTGAEPLKISGHQESYESKKGMLARSEWKLAKPGSKTAVPAIIAEGMGTGRTLMIEKPRQSPQRTPVKALTAAQKKAAEKKAREQEIHNRMMQLMEDGGMLLKAVPDTLKNRKDLELVVEAFAGPFSASEYLRKRNQKLHAFKPAELVKVLLLHAYSQMPGDEVEIATRWGVDLKKLRKEVETGLAKEEEKAKARNKQDAVEQDK